MSDKRYAVMFIRLGLLASVIFTIFWSVWHLFGFQVPAYASLKITESMSLTFPISRWWDIPFAFLLVNMYAWILRFYYNFGLKFAEKEELVVGLGAGLGIGLVVGLGVGLGVSLVAGVGVGLIFLIKVLFSSNFYKQIYNWFVVRDIT